MSPTPSSLLSLFGLTLLGTRQPAHEVIHSGGPGAPPIFASIGKERDLDSRLS